MPDGYARPGQPADAALNRGAVRLARDAFFREAGKDGARMVHREFQDVFRDYPSVKLAEHHIHITFEPPASVRVSVVCDIDYSGTIGRRAAVARREAAGLLACGSDVQARSECFLRCIFDAASETVWQCFEGLPDPAGNPQEDLETFRRSFQAIRYAAEGRRMLGYLFAELADQAACAIRRSLEADMEQELQDAILRPSSELDLPGTDYLPATAVDFALEMTDSQPDCLRAVCQGKAVYGSGAFQIPFRFAAESGHLSDSLLGLDPIGTQDRLAGEFEDLCAELSARMRRTLPISLVLHDGENTGWYFPEGLYDAVRRAPEADTLAAWDLFSALPLTKRGRPHALLEYLGDNAYRLWEDAGMAASVQYPFSMDVSALSTPWDLETMGGPGEPLDELERFCRAFRDLYEAQVWPEDLTKPRVRLLFGTRRSLSCEAAGQSYSLQAALNTDGPDTVKVRLERVLDGILAAERGKRSVYALNPAQNSLVRHIAKAKRTAGLTERVLRDWSLKNCGLDADHIGEVLEGLPELRVPGPDGEEALVVCVSQPSGGGSVLRYAPGPALDRALAGGLRSRPYRLNELCLLRDQHRKSWFLRLVSSAQEPEELWAALDVLEHHMDREYVRFFASSPAGSAFFHRFHGEEALYVRFFLDEVSGCEELAEEAEREAQESAT